MSINITDFNNEFETKVIDLCEECVELIIKCKLNSELLFVPCTLTQEQWDENTTTLEKFECAFSENSSAIQSWANSVRTNPSVFGSYIPTDVPGIGVTTFNNEFSVNVCRYEAYPVEKPSQYVIVFAISTTGNNQKYLESSMLLGTTSTSDLLLAAWDQVKTQAGTHASELLASHELLTGAVVLPTNF